MFMLDIDNTEQNHFMRKDISIMNIYYSLEKNITHPWLDKLKYIQKSL